MCTPVNNRFLSTIKYYKLYLIHFDMNASTMNKVVNESYKYHKIILVLKIFLFHFQHPIFNQATCECF